jgi:predicted TIM-barrel fold metal-dependent hydrolase
MNIQVTHTEPRATSRPVQQITVHTDSREILANAERDGKTYNFADYFIVDVDSHHVELDSWAEVLGNIESPVLRHTAQSMMHDWPYPMALSGHRPGLTFQDVGGRIPHQARLAEPVDTSDGRHRDLSLIDRAMHAMSIDIQVVFPQPMLEIGLHPSPEIATELVFAYNRWFCDRILRHGPKIRALIALPFHDPAACVRTVEEFANKPGVIGFLVTSQRNEAVHSRAYMSLYRMLEERGLPIGFHAGPDFAIAKSANRFVSVHALSFVTCNLIHMTNWVINGLPERFPELKVIWIESGLAWIPFLMQRLDHEYLMRQSDAPLLKRLPSAYMREMYYTSQPIEATDMNLLEATFRAINAETQLLWASDWPHWDFDTPGRMASLPFITEPMLRNILGENARGLFKL